SSVVWPTRFTQCIPRAAAISAPTVASRGVPNRIHWTDDCALIFSAASAKRLGNQRLAGPYSAPGQRPILIGWRLMAIWTLDVDRRKPGRELSQTNVSAPHSRAIRRKRSQRCSGGSGSRGTSPIWLSSQRRECPREPAPCGTLGNQDRAAARTEC